MNPSSDEISTGLQSSDTVYSLDVIAELAGTDPQTVLHYQEIGLLFPTSDPAEFDDEGLRRLRRIEHLRATCEVNSAGLKLILSLLDEVERLQQERRRQQW
jgi:DNA-binding transcriptional MerR regulator